MEKPRQVRPSIRVAAVAVALLLVGLLATTVWSRSQRRGAEEELRAVVGPPDSVPYASSQVGDDRNATIPLRTAVSLLEVPEAHRSTLVALTLVPESGRNTAQRELADRFLAANTAALTQLYEAGRRQASGFGLVDPRDEPAELQSLMPALQLLWAQRLLVTDAGSAWRDGDRDRFAAALAAMTSLASALEREAPFLAGVSGVAAEQMLLAVVLGTLAQPDCDVPTVDLLRRGLVTEDLRHVWHRVIANEDRQADLNLRRYGQSERPSWLGRIALDRERTRQVRLYATLARTVDTPFGSARDWRAEREREMSRRAPLAVPALVDGAVRFQATMAGRQLAAAGLWVRERGLSDGAYPSTLAGCPEAEHPDPFSGRPLLLVPADDGGVTLEVDGGQEPWAASPGGSSSPMALTLRLPPLPTGA